MQEERLARLIARQVEKRPLAAVWAGVAGLAPGMRVLDIGAGTGALALEYAAMVAPGFVVALDLDEACLAHAEAEAARRGLTLRTIAGHAETVLSPDTPFDRVMLTDTLHHIREKAAALRAIRTVLAAAGRLFVAEYDPECPGLLGAPRERRIDAGTVLALLAGAGFTPHKPAAGPDEHYTILADP
ncbi:MAG: class I SAM-dependent methyltransferase [Acidiphilium sp.]